MKIAIPTIDGLVIATQCHAAPAFLVLTVELGEIVDQEKRINRDYQDQINNLTTFNVIHDCDVLIANEVMEGPASLLKSQDKKIVKTNETIITKVIMEYLGSSYINEANTCCCP